MASSQMAEIVFVETKDPSTDALQHSSSVKISVKQPVAEPLKRKVPPPVAAKPAKVYSPASAELRTPTEDFPPPPIFDDEVPPATNGSADSALDDELDMLTSMLSLGLQNTHHPDFFGVCYKCRDTIIGEGKGCTAMGNQYHVSCFLCKECEKRLTGLEFYCLNDNPLCEQCYTNTLEDCVVCDQKITERILKAVGKSYHPQCFKCTNCSKKLDGVPFTLDSANRVHCVECYQVKFSPKCAACNELIMPTNDRGETVHIVSMQKNFHVHCYKCEDCGILLSNEEGRGCFPIGDHLLCQRCNGKRMANTTEL